MRKYYVSFNANFNYGTSFGDVFLTTDSDLDTEEGINTEKEHIITIVGKGGKKEHINFTFIKELKG
jgi:hypothetical protein